MKLFQKILMQNTGGGEPVLFFQMSDRTELGKSSRGGNFQSVTLVEPYSAFQLSFVLFVAFWSSELCSPSMCFRGCLSSFILPCYIPGPGCLHPKQWNMVGKTRFEELVTFARAVLCGSGSPECREYHLASCLSSSVAPHSLSRAPTLVLLPLEF